MIAKQLQTGFSGAQWSWALSPQLGVSSHLLLTCHLTWEPTLDDAVLVLFLFMVYRLFLHLLNSELSLAVGLRPCVHLGTVWLQV